MVEDVRRFDHFDHEGALPGGKFVLGADAGEDSVDDPNSYTFCWHIASDLCHQAHKSGLAEISGLPCHVGAGYDERSGFLFSDV